MHVATEDLTDAETPVTLPDNASFDVSWAMTLVREAVRLLEVEETAKGSGVPFAELKRFLPGFQGAGSPTYEDLEARFGVKSETLRVRVTRLRKRFGELINSVLADTVANAADLESERQALLGGMIRSLG